MVENAAPASSLIVAIDGPSGVGKTTVARAVAKRLGVPYLGTGAMYRAVAVKVLDEGLDPADRETVEELAHGLDLELELDSEGQLEVLLEGAAIGDRIGSLRVSQVTSQISVYRGVRRRMVELQRAWGRRYGAVLEGRDIGTRVFPETPHKFFLDAPLDVRVERRWRELSDRDPRPLAEVEREVRERDDRDTSRADSPLVCDETYVRVETAGRTVSEIVEFIVAAVGRS